MKRESRFYIVTEKCERSKILKREKHSKLLRNGINNCFISKSQTKTNVFPLWTFDSQWRFPPNTISVAQI